MSKDSKRAIPSEVINFKLDDVIDYDDKSIRGKIAIENDRIILHFQGYGDAFSDDSDGYPVLIELYEGTPRVVIWEDINIEEPTRIISLERSRCELREEEE